MAFDLDQINPQRVRSSLIRIPLATKGILAIILLFYVLSFFGIEKWAQLDPDVVFPSGAHRLNTFPFLHLGLFHMLVNIVAVIPLLDKFEQANGTITTVLLILGPFSTFPGILYTLLCKALHMHTPIQGASVWSFLFFAATVYQYSLTSPQFSIPSTTAQVPTLAIPFILIVITSLFIPHTSLFGHICAVIIGFGWGSGLLKFLAPPEKILRWVEDKGRLRSRLPASYVSVDKGTMGRYGELPIVGGESGILNGERVGLIPV